MKYISSAATAIGMMSMTIIELVAGVQNINAKPHVLTYVRNINFR